MKSKYYNFEHEITPPFGVVLVDQFQGHCEEGYGPDHCVENLEEAIEMARKITEEGIKECGTIEKWLGFGDAGLVYDSQGLLVWDGVKEYKGQSDNEGG